MKKLLTVSVLAIMAVSAANADIASTGITGEANFQGTNYLDAAQDLTAAAVALDSEVKTNAGAIDAVKGRMDAAEADITTLDGTVAGHTESITKLGTTVEQIKQGTGVNKATKNAAGIVQVGENIEVTDGVISVATAGQGTAGIVELATYDTVGQTNNFSATDNTKAVTGEAVAKYLDNVISTNILTELEDKQDKSTANYQMGTAGGGWQTMTQPQQDALNSGVTSETVAKAASALQQADIASGSTNGTIKVKGTDVTVKGLGTAAYTASTDYATSAQGAKADTALQQADIATGSAQGTISVKGEDVTVNGLGTAAYTASTDYATAAQGALASTAMQLADLKKDASWTEKGCNASGVVCSLVSRGGDLAWEKVAE